MSMDVPDGKDTQATREGMISGLSVLEIEQLLGIFKKILGSELPSKHQPEESNGVAVPSTLVIEHGLKSESSYFFLVPYFYSNEWL